MRIKENDEIKRQNRVLEIIINAYVNTAEPIGSRFVSRIIGLSSATVRNVMSDLEEMGYIMQPHTSAGRIPTEKGYRCYVNYLMKMRVLTKEQMKKVEREYRNAKRTLEDIIKKTADLLSAITLNTGIVLFPKFKKTAFRHIDLVYLGPRKVLVVLITSSGIVKNFMTECTESICNDLDRIVSFLNSEFYDMDLEDIKRHLLDRLKKERDSSYKLLKNSLDILNALIDFYLKTSEEIYFGKTSPMFVQPEFKDPERVKRLIKTFEKKDDIRKLMLRDLDEEGIKVHIGKENPELGIGDYSILTSSYSIKENIIGRLGIIGPTRMRYRYVVPVLSFVSQTMGQFLNQFFGEE